MEISSWCRQILSTAWFPLGTLSPSIIIISVISTAWVLGKIRLKETQGKILLKMALYSKPERQPHTVRLFPKDDSCSHDNAKNLSPAGTSRRTSPTASTRSQELSLHLSNHPAGHRGLGSASCACAAHLPGFSLASDERKSKQIPSTSELHFCKRKINLY